MTLRSPVRLLLAIAFFTTGVAGLLLTSWELMIVSGLVLVAVYTYNRHIYVFPMRTALVLAILYAVMWLWWILVRSAG